MIYWSEQFAERVRKRLRDLDAVIESNNKDLQADWAAMKAATKSDPKLPGGDSVRLAQKQRMYAGAPWRRAVFQSMIYDLRTPCDIYKNLGPKPKLPEITDAIKRVGEHWTDSAQRTRKYLAMFSKWARQELHRQVTFYSLSGRTNFDPVQLAFALRIHHDVDTEPDGDLIAKGLEIVVEMQHADGTWPTGAPFVVDRLTLAAVHVANIEIMNALMPLIDKDVNSRTRYQRCAHRVFDWLEKNHRVVSSPQRSEIAGWSTDRLLEAERVDMWATAAALQFLIAYGKLRQHLLKLKMAETFDFFKPALKWSAIVDAELDKSYKERVTSKIYENYIRPFKDTGQSEHSAMVLHGPPGTAKSTLAQALAAELCWSLVTITPSDFVKEGIEQSENKARQLFKELLLLRETVVLFDELDEMLRDRQDQESQTGIAMLRFLIPGMLPKLQALKQFGEKNRLIFIVATNYKDRLDSAVIRTGRVDDAFAVIPPDEPSRYCLLWNFLHNAGYEPSEKERLASFLAARTQGWVFKEIEHLVGLVRKRIPPRRSEEREEKNLKDLLAVRDLSPKALLNTPLADYKSYSLLGQQAALDIFHFYSRRQKASDEILNVLGAYGVSTRGTSPAKKLALVHAVTGKPSDREGLKIVPDQYPRWLD